MGLSHASPPALRRPATANLIYFPKQRGTARRARPADKKKPKPKATVLDWIRNGYTFPGKP